MEMTVVLAFITVIYVFYIEYVDKPKIKMRKRYFCDISKLHSDVQLLISKQEKLAAIKKYRSIYGAGLKEASDVICRHLP